MSLSLSPSWGVAVGSWVWEGRQIEEAVEFHSGQGMLFCKEPGVTEDFSQKKTCICAKLLESCPTLCDPVDYRLPDSLSMGLSVPEDWRSGLPFPPPGVLLNPGIKPVSPALAGRFFTTDPPGKPILVLEFHITRILQLSLSTLYARPLHIVGCICIHFWCCVTFVLLNNIPPLYFVTCFLPLLLFSWKQLLLPLVPFKSIKCAVFNKS